MTLLFWKKHEFENNKKGICMTNGEAPLKRERGHMAISRSMVLRKLNCAPGRYPQTLEARYPHVLERIVALWNSSDGEEYLNDLLKPNCSGGRHERDGFPSRAWDEIYYLLTLYKKPRLNPDRQNNKDSGRQNSNLVGRFLSVFDNK
jgi:hypothetical protein